MQADLRAEHGPHDVLRADVVFVPFQALVERGLAACEFSERLEDQVEIPGVETVELLHAFLVRMTGRRRASDRTRATQRFVTWLKPVSLA